MKLLLTCREASRMVSEQQDRTLGPIERTRLHLHLRLCDGCTGFAQQMQVLRNAMRRPPPEDDRH